MQPDIYTEQVAVDLRTLRNLGPLTGLAGIWEGSRSLDVNPKAAGPLRRVFVEHTELQPIDPQANGPQLFYGLRYHTHIVKPGEVETYHDQVGYWLWEPATGNLIQTIAIPRGQTVMAFGHAAKDATWAYDEDNDADRATAVGAVPSHGSQCSDEDCRADTQSPRTRLSHEHDTNLTTITSQCGGPPLNNNRRRSPAAPHSNDTRDGRVMTN